MLEAHRMKVAWSVLVGDARGKCGNVAATLTYAGSVLRGRVRAKQSNSQQQLEMRAALGSLSTLWSDPSMLTYRAGWVALGLNHPELGIFTQNIFKTGLQWFIRANRNRQVIGESIILEAPAFAAVGDPGALTLTFTPGAPGTLEVAATTPSAAGEAVIIAATPGISPGILTLGHQQRKVFTSTAGSESSWDIIAEYTARFGAPVSGKQIFVEAWYMDIAQGRIGLKSRVGTII